MPVLRLQQKSYQLEDCVVESYAMAYYAYLAGRNLPRPEPRANATLPSEVVLDLAPKPGID
jgi:hypothetical protein